MANRYSGRTTGSPLRRERGASAGAGGGGSRRRPGPARRKKRLIDYPRSGKRGARRFLPSFKQLLGCFIFVVLLGAGFFIVSYILIPVPAPNEVAVSQTSVITYDNGKPLGRLAAQNREKVSIDKVPKHVQHAVLAAEDREFYSEPGFSVTGILRAAWAYVRNEPLQGGSTVTQQYVKKTYLTDERTFTRKWKELILSIKIEQELSKDQILQRYLNTVYFGRGSYGVQTASHAYFDKGVSKLTPSEGAVLASLIRNPSLYDPVRHKENLKPRFEYVINGMASQGWLSAEQVSSMKLPKTVKPDESNQYKGERGYLIAMVKDELERRGISEDELLTGGYQVHTTFNKKMMKYAKQAVKEAYPDYLRQENVDIGMAAVEPGTGRIVAIYGGKNYLKDQFNNALRGGLTQPGSSFKPYVLASALKKGIGLRTTYDGHSPKTVAGHTFKNAGAEQFGYIDLATATEHSVNTVYVQLGQDVGLHRVIKNAKKVGIQTGPWCPLGPGNTKMDAGASTPLGPMDVCPMQQAGGYATFANKGKYVQPTAIDEVTNASGDRVIYKANPDPRKVFSKGVAADTLYALQQVVQGGTGTAAILPDGRPVAGKTGTTNDNRSAWFVGTVPQLTASVAVYKSNGHQIPYTVYGGSVAAPVWEAFMAKATEHMKVKDFPDPAWVGEARHNYPTEPVTTYTSEPTDTYTQEPSDTPTNTPTPTDTPTAPS
ncbi:MAG: transglycosylase domain-containing protein, partial [Streptosporangiales bacterium]